MSHQFRGQSTRRPTRRSGFSQASTRRPIRLFDQHGRQWSAQVDNKSGMPTGQITPDFYAPWYPDQQYLRVNPDNQAELFIDYDALLERRRARMQEYHRVAVEFAREQKLTIPTQVGVYSESIRAKIGGQPKAFEPVIAAMQGNRYILGLTKRVDERLAKYVTPMSSTEQLLDAFDFSDAPTFSDVRARNEARQSAEGADEDGDEDGDERAPTADDVDEDLDALDAGAETEAALLDALEPEPAPETDALEALEEEIDPAALGGRTIKPGQEERGAPRRPRGGRTLSQQRKAQRGNRPTLASGAAPVIAGSDVD